MRADGGSSVEDEARVEAMRQRLRQCVARSDWRDSEVWRRLALKLEGELPGVESFVVDDTLPHGRAGQPQGVASWSLAPATAQGVGRHGRPRTRYEAQGVKPWIHAQLALQLPEEE